MADNRYDVIVVGARCAGSPTAMLLARRGHKVLVVDRARFPSDTVSTHLLHPPGVAALARWGLLERLEATGCPPIAIYAFDFGPFTISGSPGTDQAPVAYGPRRTVLDKLLVDAAAEAGAEVREGFTVTELVLEDGRVVGAAATTARAGWSPSGPGWSSGPTGATRRWPGRSHPSSTTSGPRCCAATTATGAGCPWTAASRPGSAPTAASPPGPPTTT
jgi:hypothetical protein